MSFDGTAEEDAIETRLKTLVGGRVHTSIPEESTLATDPDTRLILPYILLTFGSMYPSQTDRSIEGPEQQPQVMPVIVECWASNDSAARRTAGAVRTLMVGWAPDPDNATEFEMFGGGWFQQKDASGRPTRYMKSVNLSTVLNMSISAP